MWSHLTAAQYPSAPTGVPDDFGVVFADEVAIPAIVELEPREDEVLLSMPPRVRSRFEFSAPSRQIGANSMGFLVSEDGMDVDQDPGLRSLLDLARENLALKQQLKSANHELSRLQVRGPAEQPLPRRAALRCICPSRAARLA